MTFRLGPQSTNKPGAGCRPASSSKSHDRAIVRFLAERDPEPTATIFDGRTPQSTPESGKRAGYDGAKKKKRSKVHAAVDTLGNLLALKITAANEQERAKVAELADKVQEVTGSTVEIAYVDQGYTGKDAAQQAEQAGIKLTVVKHKEAKRGVCAAAATLGRGANLWMSRTLSTIATPLRTTDPNARGLALARVRHTPARKRGAEKCITGSGHAREKSSLGRRWCAPGEGTPAREGRGGTQRYVTVP